MQSDGARACWHPLLSGAERQQALRCAHAIADALARRVPSHPDPSLASGQAGFALLFALLAQVGHQPSAATLAQQCLDRATEAMAREEMDASLYTGFPGVAWAVALVDRLLARGSEGRGDSVDEALSALLARPRLWPVPHDLIEGATGAGVYALERWPRPLALECIGHVVARLNESARTADDGVYWWTPPETLDPAAREECPSGRADLGVAHGQPGPIALLGAVLEMGAERTVAGGLLEGAVSWLLAQAIANDAGPTFPLSVAPDRPPEPARSAWCYGDPGVACALLTAARAVGNAQWERQAVALARRAAARRAAASGVLDAGFCHGSAGLAHLYNRMYQATGEPALRSAAVCWVERTVEFCRQAERAGDAWVLGADDPSQDPEQAPWAGLDIVAGATGVALVLLAASTSVEPVWDRMFVPSGPGCVGSKRASR